MRNVVLMIKGFIMGIANIIPGVSGGTLALTLGIYEDFIGAISHFFSRIKENIKFLLPIAIGIGLSIITMSNIITASFDHFPIPTTLFFMGLVIGGIPMLYNKVKESREEKQISSYIIALLTFSLVMILALSEQIFGSRLGEVNLSNLNTLGYVTLFIIGVITAATMVIPGVSGSLVLMLLGYYLPIINVIKELTKFQNIASNMLITGIFGVGVLVGIVLISKLIEYLLNKYEKKTYFGVLGFIIASIVAIPISVFNKVGNITFEIPQVLIGVIFLVFGVFVGYKLGEK
ncbi:MAG: DUF368 domain-containing protein [bacterium]|nr:DUF368 domain-containing protein [bacterium]